MRGSEWSLVIFTIFSQAAVGLFITAGFLNYFGSAPRETGIRILQTVGILIVFAMALSFFHLGKPKNAIYVLSNLSQSWLSREILSLILFAASAFIYGFLYYKGFSQTMQAVSSIIASLFGLALIYSMSKVYMLETVPSWNTILTPAQFYVTAAVLGVITAALFIRGAVPEAQGLKILLSAALVFVTISIVLWIFTITRADTGVLLIYFRSVLLVTAFAALVYILYKGAGYAPSGLLLLVYLILLLSELSGRYIFYASYKSVGV